MARRGASFVNVLVSLLVMLMLCQSSAWAQSKTRATKKRRGSTSKKAAQTTAQKTKRTATPQRRQTGVTAQRRLQLPGWVRTWGGAGREFGNGVAADSKGNVYVVSDLANQACLAKYTSGGKLVWRKSWKGSGTVTAKAVAVQENPTRGLPDMIYVTGGFKGAVRFNPGSRKSHTADVTRRDHGDQTVSTRDAYLSIFNSSGHFVRVSIWQGKIGQKANDDAGNCVAIDGSGYVYIGGESSRWKYSRQKWAKSREGGFLCKYSSSGDLRWERNWSMVTATDITCGGRVLGMAIDHSVIHVVLMAGTEGHSAGYLRTYGPSGSIVGGKNHFQGQLQGIALGEGQAGTREVYIVGRFNGGCDFDPGEGRAWRRSSSLPLHYWDSFLLKLGPNREFRWVQTWGKSGTNQGAYGVATNQSGRVLVTGRAGDEAFLKLFTDTDNNQKYASESADGNAAWTRQWGGTGSGVAIDSAGAIYVTGAFSDLVDFSPSQPSSARTGRSYRMRAGGGTDAFLLRCPQ